METALFGVDVTVPLILRPDGSLTLCPKEKADLFVDVFDSKQINKSLTMPVMFSRGGIDSICFLPGEVKKLLFELDPYGGSGSDGAFFCILLKLLII